MKNKVDCIYVIDDDPITIFGIKKALEEVVDCKELHSFVNGKEAIDHICSNLENGKSLPNLIFLDINMPIMDGWGFMEEFHKLEINTSIRINIVTSSIDPADHEMWLHYKKKSPHLVEYKNKPIFKITPEDIVYMNKAS